MRIKQKNKMKRTNKVCIKARDITKATIAASKDDEHRQVAKSRGTKENEEMYWSSNNKIGKG